MEENNDKPETETGGEKDTTQTKTTNIDLEEFLNDVTTKFRSNISDAEWNEMTSEITEKINKLKRGELLEEPDWKSQARAMYALKILNPEKFDYDKYLNTLKQLEERIGKINFVPAINEITDEEHRNNYLTYFFKRSMGAELTKGLWDSIRLSWEKKIEEEKIQENTHEKGKTKELNLSQIFSNLTQQIFIDHFSTTNKTTIERYFTTWDFILNNFIVPIFNAMRKSKTIPQTTYQQYKRYFDKKPWPTHLKLQALEEYFEANDFCDPLKIWIENMNTRLRNSLVHEKYYIKNDVIYYYYKKRNMEIKFEKISISELKEINSKQFAKILLIPRVIGIKLVEDLNLLEE